MTESTEALQHTDVQPIYARRESCRACDSKTLVDVLDLGVHYLPRFVEEPDDNLPQSPLHLVRCALCGLLQLQHTVNPDLLYREFWYRSSVNATMRDALADLVDATVKFRLRKPLSAGVWLDIGANDGFLLSRVSRQFTKIAVEPALNFRDDLKQNADEVILDYFSKDIVGQKCDVITSAAMFYDLDDPNSFVADIAALLSNDGVWVNQLNDSPTMLRANAFDAVCHEHLCYWSVPALDALYLKHGLQINQITHNDINGGSVRIFATKIGTRPQVPMLGVPDTTQTDCFHFAERVKRWKILMKDLLNHPPFNRTPLWGYGASTKGSTLLQYLDESDRFLAIADRNPLKHGLRMAGTWIPIASEAEFRKANPKFAMVLPWAFRNEFVKREQDYRDAGGALLFPLPNPEVVL